jgi:drug/metabolite transporter (DMT)-like permease
MYHRKPFPKGKEWYPILILSLFNFILSNGLATWGVKYISAGLGSIIGAIVPLWVVFIGVFIGRKMDIKTILGMVLGFGGICVVFYEHLVEFANPDFTFGIIISVLGTLTWAIGSLFTKKQASNFNPYFSIGLQMVIAGITLLTTAGFTGNTMPLLEIPLHSWIALAFLIFFGSIMAFRAYIYALQRLPTEQASIYAYINPIVAVLFGALIFGEKLTPFLIAGGLITLLGVYIVNQSYKKGTTPSESKKRFREVKQ